MRTFALELFQIVIYILCSSVHFTLYYNRADPVDHRRIERIHFLVFVLMCPSRLEKKNGGLI